MKTYLHKDGTLTFEETPRGPKDWKIYFFDGKFMPCFRGGDGPRENGKPEHITLHPATNYPHWDWVELEDGTWLWLHPSPQEKYDKKYFELYDASLTIDENISNTLKALKEDEG